ncbi:hypothetical protein H4S04_003094 [Coemansia sp. S16]|nr:hypothetical protein H4S04_003094 [Coemansia sp. S16]
MQDALNSDEVQSIRLKESPTAYFFDRATTTTEIEGLISQLAEQHPSLLTLARGKLSAGSIYVRGINLVAGLT